MFVAFGEGRAIVAYAVVSISTIQCTSIKLTWKSQHGGADYAFQFYGPDENPEGKYGDSPTVSIAEITRTLDPRSVLPHQFGQTTYHSCYSNRLENVVRHARKGVRVTIRAHDDIEDWVEDDGRLVLIGEAAHPFPVSLHCP